jgi:hypothetical protein
MLQGLCNLQKRPSLIDQAIGALSTRSPAGMNRSEHNPHQHELMVEGG